MARHEYPTITPILHSLVKRAPSGIGALTIADMLGWNYPTMMSELSGQPGHKCGVERLLPVMDVTGSDAPMHLLSREMGGVYIKLPPSGSEVDPVQRQCMVAVKEFGELIAVCSEALLNGSLEPDERSKILREGHEAVTAIMGLLTLVETSR